MNIFKKSLLFSLIVFFSFLSTTCLNDDPLKLPFQSYVPPNLGDGWEIATPEEAGINSEALEDLYRYVHEDTNFWQIRSLLIFKNNKLVAESYMKDRDDRTNLHPIWSCTKQVMGILTGIAIDKHLISINDTILDHLPQVSNHPEKSKITIENLLMMKSGINFDNGEDNDKWGSGKELDTLDYVLGMGMQSSPGSKFHYNDGDPHIISAILQKKTGITTSDWAREVLFDKIGITRLDWYVYNDGRTMGGWGILTTPREMGKIGQLVANDGMWNGEQIVSKNWINEMTTARVPPSETQNTDVAFCYLWWKDIKRNVDFAWGHGGQYILINKDKNLIVVITSEKHLESEHNLLSDKALSIYDMVNSLPR